MKHCKVLMCEHGPGTVGLTVANYEAPSAQELRKAYPKEFDGIKQVAFEISDGRGHKLGTMTINSLKQLKLWIDDFVILDTVQGLGDPKVAMLEQMGAVSINLAHKAWVTRRDGSVGMVAVGHDLTGWLLFHSILVNRALCEAKPIIVPEYTNVRCNHYATQLGQTKMAHITGIERLELLGWR